MKEEHPSFSTYLCEDFLCICYYSKVYTAVSSRNFRVGLQKRNPLAFVMQRGDLMWFLCLGGILYKCLSILDDAL